MTERGLVELYVNVCEELALNDDERRRLWFRISAEIERVESELPDPGHATFDEIAAVCERLGVPSMKVLVTRARNPSTSRTKRSSQAASQPWHDDPRELLALYWPTIEELIGLWRQKLKADEEETDTVESRVKEALFDHDFEIVRQYRHESSFRGYLSRIVQRTFLNLRVERYGRWHHSAAAERMGPLAMDLERMIYRDGYMPGEAISVLLTSHPEITRPELQQLVEALPGKLPRLSKVPLDDVVAVLVRGSESEELLLSNERFRLSERTAAVIRRYLDGLADDDRLLLQLLFETKRTMATIARMLAREQKALYRRRDQLFAQLRRELVDAGISRTEAKDVYDYISEHWATWFAKKRH